MNCQLNVHEPYLYSKCRHLSDEEAEAEFSRRHKARNLFTLMMRYREQEASGSTEGNGDSSAAAQGTFIRSYIYTLNKAYSILVSLAVVRTYLDCSLTWELRNL